jgi:hypothetical protein
MLPNRLHLPFFVLFFIASIVACAPNVGLSTVSQYATMAQQAQASFDAIADDFDASCARQRELAIQLNDLTWAPWVPTPSAAPTNTPSIAKPTPTPFFSPSLPEECVVTIDYEEHGLGSVSADWRKGNDTLLAYVQSLGALANVNAAPSPSGVATFSGAAAKVGLIPAPTATLLVSFLDSIYSYWQQREREQSIARFVIAMNSPDPKTGVVPFPAAISALTVVGKAYTGLIDGECSKVNSVYGSALAGLYELTPKSGPQAKFYAPVAIERAHRLRIRWANDLTACYARDQTAPAYLATLDKLSATNDSLNKAVREPSSSRDVLLHNISDLSASVSSLYALVTAAHPGVSASPSAPAKKPKE